MKRQSRSPLSERCCLLLPSLWLLLIIHPPTGQGCPASILKTVDRRPLLSSRPSPSPDDKGGPSPTRSALQRVRVRHSRFLLPPLFPPPSVFAGHLRQLWRRFTHIFHKEIEALTEADPREENILELIRTLPEAVSEGHHETVHSLKRGWAALQHKALEGLLVVGWGGGEEGAEGGGEGRGLSQAVWRSRVAEVEQHATLWVTKKSREHLEQALHCLSLLTEHASSRLDPASQLDVIERLLITLRSATDGGLMPGADGRKFPYLLTSCPSSLPPSLPPSSLDSGLPYVIKGMFHLNCPPPLKSISKAKGCFLQALEVNPRSGRNLYFCGLAAFLEGEHAKAQAYYTAAQLLLPAEIKRDAQYAFLDVECRRGMSLVREKLRGKGGREGGGEDVLVEGEGEGEEEVVKSLWWKRTGWRGRFL
ncbi:hypothetical protein NSK_007985 [Nannochloropsis salina CCMP1776]|uniref:Uncharacterized protein n=1 Tax=Nannochloropsis salina CCMP1776 TaxID=1027361 RepID=A0A4D9CW18_9STRA|nr:hypothetical protein NSK_007985 [Nannochloropsis salina CCMP1776]|eukprot:TFJ80808.1 hypothetical protein NSK_007985 [Nannochloropsis salina CCMP1776]